MMPKPERFIGMHFMNPVPVMPLIEVIRGLQTSDATHAATVALTELMGKTPATSQDRPGFIANRVLMPYINEAITCLQDNISTKEDIDKILKLGTDATRTEIYVMRREIYVPPKNLAALTSPWARFCSPTLSGWTRVWPS